jgi:hypothetical protein
LILHQNGVLLLRTAYCQYQVYVDVNYTSGRFIMYLT